MQIHRRVIAANEPVLHLGDGLKSILRWIFLWWRHSKGIQISVSLIAFIFEVQNLNHKGFQTISSFEWLDSIRVTLTTSMYTWSQCGFKSSEFTETFPVKPFHCFHNKWCPRLVQIFRYYTHVKRALLLAVCKL